MSNMGISSSRVDPLFQGTSPFFQDVLRRRKYTAMTDHGGIIINGGGGDGESGKEETCLLLCYVMLDSFSISGAGG